MIGIHNLCPILVPGLCIGLGLGLNLYHILGIGLNLGLNLYHIPGIGLNLGLILYLNHFKLMITTLINNKNSHSWSKSCSNTWFKSGPRSWSLSSFYAGSYSFSNNFYGSSSRSRSWPKPRSISGYY